MLPGRTLSVSLRSTASSPFCRLAATSSPGRGKSFEGRALGKEGRPPPHSSTVRRSQPISAKLYAPAKASPSRERWHGEAVTERVASGTNPFRHFALRNATSPEGGALGKEGKFRPHRPTARRSLLISAKLYAFAKASPSRERWHGIAVTERVASGTNPLSRLRRQLVPLFVAWRRHLPPAGGSLSKGEPLAKRVSFVLTGQRQKKPAYKRKTFRPCQSLSLSGEVARRSRDGEGGLQNPHTQKLPPEAPEGVFLQQTPLISDIYARHGPRCRPGCRRPGTRPRPGRPPAAPQT